MLSRRNALTRLGLAATVGFAAEDMMKDEALAGTPPHITNGYLTGNDVDLGKFAKALRKLADEIDNGSVRPESLHVDTLVEYEKFVKQTLTLNFTLHDNDPA